jgi:glycosyltransferase involved in cell wall biosynthesis
MSVLGVRDGFADFAHVRSEELFAGADRSDPFLTIAIPTFRRPDLLAEAVRSALAQQLDRPIEIVVVDDDPRSTGHERLLQDVPEIAAANFRYLRNSHNIRDCGSFTRAVELARGEWLTILHDDDLLDPGFARDMFREIDADPRIDGLVCRKRIVDCRHDPYRETRGRAAGRKLVEWATFGLRRVRPIKARQLFWGCVPGNTVGYIFRKADAVSLGGFYPEDYPSADYHFYARFAARFRLCEYRKLLATIRIARDNMSLTMEVSTRIVTNQHRIQRALVASGLPRYWEKIVPLAVSRHVALQAKVWRSGISHASIGNELGFRLPRDRPFLLYALRGLLRGF